jgi:integrase/recombinase XerD
MTSFQVAMADYLAVRRAVGYKLNGVDRVLRDFVAHLHANQIATVTVNVAVEWVTATGRGSSPGRRLTIIRGFARYLQALDPAHQVPPTRILPIKTSRPVPYLYSHDDITALMGAARILEPAQWADTVETILGMLWVTGMRIGEVLRLNVGDFNTADGVVTVWLSKFGKSRHVPLAPSTIAALTGYRALQPDADPTAAMFVTPSGKRVPHAKFALAFAVLLTDTGIVTVNGQRPRIHDLRHSFAVRTLLGWYRTGVDVHPLLPRLSTYLGHVEPESTYWYLSAAPELMSFAAQRLERLQELGS